MFIGQKGAFLATDGGRANYVALMWVELIILFGPIGHALRVREAAVPMRRAHPNPRMSNWRDLARRHTERVQPYCLRGRLVHRSETG